MPASTVNGRAAWPAEFFCRPATCDFGLLHATAPHVVASLVEWHASLGIGYNREAVTGDIRDALDRLTPEHTPPTKILFTPFGSGWTAYFDNSRGGSDVFPVVSHLATTLLMTTGMRLCCTAPDAAEPAVIWEVYEPEERGGVPPLGYRRSLDAAKDGESWAWTDEGPPYDFEDIQAYRQRRIRDRLPPHLLGSLCRGANRRADGL